MMDPLTSSFTVERGEDNKVGGIVLFVGKYVMLVVD